MTHVVLALCLLLVPRLALGAFSLAWKFPRSSNPQPTSFTITYRGNLDPGGTLQQMQAPWVPASACQRMLEAEGDMFCVQFPTCPAPDTYTFWVATVWPTQTSDKSN